MKHKVHVVTLAVIAVACLCMVRPASAVPFAQCPPTGAATSCAVLYTFNSDGSVSTSVDPSISSTDGIEDTLAGVQNNSGHTISSLTLSGIGVNGLGVFDFDGDGQSAIPCPPATPGATYCGQFHDASGALLGTTFFSGLSSIAQPNDTGTINFPGLPNGGSGWWVLEDQISFSAPPTVSGVPEPTTFLLLAPGSLGLLAFGWWRRERAA